MTAAVVISVFISTKNIDWSAALGPDEKNFFPSCRSVPVIPDSLSLVGFSPSSCFLRSLLLALPSLQPFNASTILSSYT